MCLSLILVKSHTLIVTEAYEMKDISCSCFFHSFFPSLSVLMGSRGFVHPYMSEVEAPSHLTYFNSQSSGLKTWKARTWEYNFIMLLTFGIEYQFMTIFLLASQSSTSNKKS